MEKKELDRIVKESVKDVISNKLSGYKDGAPSSIKDVIVGNGWSVGPVQKIDGMATMVRVYNSYNPFRKNMSVKELADDLNIYFQDNNKKIVATPIENEGGCFIKLVKRYSIKEYRTKKVEQPQNNWDNESPVDNRKQLFNQFRPTVQGVFDEYNIKLTGYGFKNFDGVSMFVIVGYSEGSNFDRLALKQKISQSTDETVVVKQNPNDGRTYVVFCNHKN